MSKRPHIPRFPALGEFLAYLERERELVRVRAEVDPHLELTEIAVRALREGRPALLFERVKGSRFPVAANVYASERRIRMALGRDPEAIGEELLHTAEAFMPPSPGRLWKQRNALRRFLAVRPRIASGVARQVPGGATFDDLPIQHCWPQDGGRFITQGQVVTSDPENGGRNVGMYRMHVYDAMTSGMHWQIGKGGGYHYRHAERSNHALEVAVALGTDPALLLASVAALPEGVDEVMFASILRGDRIPMMRGTSITARVPSNAEFILEGMVHPNERRMEGPFGDHFGHYSLAAPFPVFHLKAITHRRGAVYPATVVGIPPMEDKFIGDATQLMLAPLARLIHKEVKDVWAYYEAGFHNLLVVSVEERYRKEAMKAALGLMGTGQLSLTKCCIMVSAGVNVRDFKAVLREIREQFDPHTDFLLVPKVPLDTLDFTSFEMELGSKMVIDATRSADAHVPAKNMRMPDASALRAIDRRILDAEAYESTMLVVKVRRHGRDVVEKLVRRRELQGFRIIAAVSEDVDIRNQENCIWGIFTRFDCARDVIFAKQELIGIAPIYRGVMGIDATWKKGYPDALVMDPAVVKRVDERWGSLWNGTMVGTRSME